MSYYKPQLQDLIERTLKEINLYSDNALYLLLGTAAQESKFGTYLKQLGTGPALSLFQIEPFTFYDLRNRFGMKYGFADRKVEELEWDIKLAIIVCRIKYLSISEALPDYKDIKGMAKYYKLYYNSPKGAATEEEFISNYEKYVLR